MSYQLSVQAYQTKAKPISDLERAWIKRSLLGLKKEARILEIGSGLGERSDFIESLGYTVKRSDFSDSFIDYLKSNGHQATRLDLLTDQLPTSDLVFASAVLLHFKRSDLGSILFKINSALASNGRLVFSVKGGSGQEIVSQGGLGDRFFNYWRVDELVCLLDSNCFDIFDLKVGGSKPTWVQISAVKRN